MPSVIILTGHPCSGKTTLANLIHQRALDHHTRRITNVIVLNEESACPNQPSIAACYADSQSEKITRGALKSAFDRAVATATSNETTGSKTKTSSSTLIILDSTNYIKGYRYELYCISKAANCSHCVVWCLNSVETVQEWNSARRKGSPDNSLDRPMETYSDELLQALILRYEPPDERNRWDRPLYCIDMRPLASCTDRPELQSNATNIGQEVLDQSVYNMHNLSQVMHTESSKANDGEGASLTTAQSATPKKSLFKKSSTFQKRERPIGGGSSGQPRLTAEFLSLLSNCNDAPINGSTAQNLPQSHSQSKPGTKATKPTTNSNTLTQTLQARVDEFLNQFLGQSDEARLRQGTSTVQHVATDSDVLHMVDSVTQQVCACLLLEIGRASSDNGKSIPTGNNATRNAGETASGGLERQRQLPTWIRNGDANRFWSQLSRVATLSNSDDLRRIRHQYIQWTGTHPPQRTSPEDGDDYGMERRIAYSFLAYIESSVGRSRDAL
jgi:protein KTI12